MPGPMLPGGLKAIAAGALLLIIKEESSGRVTPQVSMSTEAEAGVARRSHRD